MTKINKKLLINGIVQGVGFRPTVYNYAQKYGLKGWVLNASHGVEIELHGAPEQIEAFIRELRSNPPRMARIDTFEQSDLPFKPFQSFTIVESVDDPADFLPVSPDLNVCPDCLKELFTPTDRRFRYPFINCTNCGPRFSIVRGIPYDRPNTSMAGFPLCPDCEKEYHDPADRRFHAQPVACPVCGPRIWLQIGNESKAEGENALQDARKLLAEGKILAIKGLGGFHLACDATNPNAVNQLRLRKKRSGKPFALMAPDLETIRLYARVNPDEEELLTSVQAPIVLLQLTEAGSRLAKIVAPDQNTLGFMLPYTPLHHLLLEKAEGFPRVLVMTSANLSEEPIVTQNDQAVKRMAGIADAFLMHNRPIETRIDDSVASIFRGERYFSRRARGYAPNPIQLAQSCPPSLACGTHLKNTFTLAREKYAFVSHHIGDLDNQETWDAYVSAIDHYQQIFRIQPELIACDLHPDYLATRYALDLSAKKNLPLIKVQHHHAHISSCLADNSWDSNEPVIGLSFDGTGYGTDGKIWGGEVFLANYRGFERRFHLQYLPLPGGEASIKKPARLALGYLAALDLLDRSQNLSPKNFLSEIEQQVVINQVRTGFNTPLNSSMGRLFDAVAALIGLYQEISYEAQNAICLEAAADTQTDQAYELPIDGEEILLKPLFTRIIADLRNNQPVSVIAARFHNTISRLAVDCAKAVRRQTGVKIVAISGGVWQNKRLLDNTIPALEADGFRVLWHHQVPTNDGGVSLGQLLTALAQTGS
jgi:hydrogenase maturation protein HypF